MCPPGRPRRKLLKALAEKRRGIGGIGAVGGSGRGGRAGFLRKPVIGRSTTISSSASPSVSSLASRFDGLDLDRSLGEGTLEAYDRAEDELLNDPDFLDRQVDADGKDIDEDASSGDEDELEFAYDDEWGVSPSAEKEKLVSAARRELLYVPVGTEPAGPGQPGVGGTAASGKLPFNRRKVRWFDVVTAQDRGTARQWLRTEMAGLRRKDTRALTAHLRRMQMREKRKVARERGPFAVVGPSSALSDDEEEDLVLEKEAIAAGVGLLPPNMTPGLSAALVLESLVLSPLESLEGLSKCYDAVVAAGTALLDSEAEEAGADGPLDSNQTLGSEKKPTRAEILSALAPVLITTLEQPSGDALICLSHLRDMCGTSRYRRRFIQRVASSLIRPPNSALWCLRHQQDMEAILRAAEVILDGAQELFSPGWHERGRTILADSKRAATLRTAADQLKKLSAGGEGGSGLGLGLGKSFTTSTGPSYMAG